MEQTERRCKPYLSHALPLYRIFNGTYKLNERTGMKRKYTMTRIYEPLYSKLKAEAAKKGVHVSVLINEKLAK